MDTNDITKKLKVTNEGARYHIDAWTAPCEEIAKDFGEIGEQYRPLGVQTAVSRAMQLTYKGKASTVNVPTRLDCPDRQVRHRYMIGKEEPLLEQVLGEFASRGWDISR